jgi:hypothetical protein
MSSFFSVNDVKLEDTGTASINNIITCDSLEGDGIMDFSTVTVNEAVTEEEYETVVPARLLDSFDTSLFPCDSKQELNATENILVGGKSINNIPKKKRKSELDNLTTTLIRDPLNGSVSSSKRNRVVQSDHVPINNDKRVVEEKLTNTVKKIRTSKKILPLTDRVKEKSSIVQVQPIFPKKISSERYKKFNTEMKTTVPRPIGQQCFTSSKPRKIK